MALLSAGHIVSEQPAVVPGCALCMLDGIWSKPIKNWPGFPICREHVAASIATTSGQAQPIPTVDIFSQSQSLH